MPAPPIPPSNLRIKRARDEDPVDTLYIESTSGPAGWRQQASKWKFMRVERERDAQTTAPRSIDHTTARRFGLSKAKRSGLALLTAQALPREQQEALPVTRRPQPSALNQADVPLLEDLNLMKTMLEYAAELNTGVMAAHGHSPDRETTDVGDDDAYVWDMYIRQPAFNAQHPDISDDEGTLTHSSFGIIVIGANDHEFWNDLEQEEDNVDEPDWDSEQDDENAENFYGADYPDEDLSSGDENNRSAYARHWYGSDQEEWGAEDDDFDMDKYPSTRPRQQIWRKAAIPHRPNDDQADD